MHDNCPSCFLPISKHICYLEDHGKHRWRLISNEQAEPFRVVILEQADCLPPHSHWQITVHIAAHKVDQPSHLPRPCDNKSSITAQANFAVIPGDWSNACPSSKHAREQLLGWQWQALALGGFGIHPNWHDMQSLPALSACLLAASSVYTSSLKCASALREVSCLAQTHPS